MFLIRKRTAGNWLRLRRARVLAATLLSAAGAQAQAAPTPPNADAPTGSSAAPPAPATREAQPSPAPPPQTGWSAPPPGWAPPPGYYYVAPPAPPPEYPIKRDQPLIAGYHVEERPRQAPITIGLIVGGTAYALGLFAASTDGFANGKGWLVVPVLGPWLAIGARKHHCVFPSSYASTCVDDESADFLLGFDGVHQAAGALLVIIGLTVTRSWAVRDGVSLHVLPQLQADRLGVSIFGAM